MNSTLAKYTCYLCRAAGLPLKARGFTLIELLIVIAILGTLAGIAIPTFASYRDKAQITKAKIEIKSMERDILTFYSDNGRYPESLAEIGLDGMKDPYGNPYQYQPAPIDDKESHGPSQDKEEDSENGNKGGNKGGDKDTDNSTDSSNDDESAKAKMRKDHNLVPVNTDFDLYSMGKDGESRAPFTAKVSRDDIVRANNGQFIGLVSAY